MRKTLFIIATFLFIALWKGACNAETLPQGYIHKPIAEQIEKYREIFDSAFEKNGNQPINKTMPIVGLYEIVKNGFALIHDEIVKNKTHIDRKEDAINQLQSTWDKLQSTVQEIPGEGKAVSLTSYLRHLSTIAVIYEKYVTNDNFPNKNEVNPYIDVRLNHVNHPLFILFGKPENVARRHISQDHFVNQICNEKYPAFLAFFDTISISPRQQKPSKLDPHYSKENGTFTLLKHDIGHYFESGTLLMRNKEAYNHILHMCKVRDTLKMDHQEKEYRLMTNGLFLLTHEVPLYGLGSNLTLEQFLSKFKRSLGSVVDLLYEDRGIKYKEELRDWEYFLQRTLDQNGNPYFDKQALVTPGREKGDKSIQKYDNDAYSEALRTAYTRFCDDFSAIIINALSSDG